jgi:hypothetical protein
MNVSKREVRQRNQDTTNAKTKFSKLMVAISAIAVERPQRNFLPLIMSKAVVINTENQYLLIFMYGLSGINFRPDSKFCA